MESGVNSIKRILVTGGSGRLGQYVVDCLRNNYEITIFDRRSPSGGERFIAGDILDTEAVNHATSGQDAIVHLAALDADVEAADDAFFTTNVQGTWNVFAGARTNDVRKVIYCSSVAALNISRENPPRYLPIDLNYESDPRGAYGLSKLVGERIARRFCLVGGMSVICLRPALILYPQYLYDVAKAVARVDGAPPPPAMQNPEWLSYSNVVSGSRSYVDPRDVANAFSMSIAYDEEAWGVFFVAATDTFSCLPTMEVIRREFAINPEIRDAPRYASDPRSSIYDISETTRALGWKPEHTWPDLFQEVTGACLPPASSIDT